MLRMRSVVFGLIFVVLCGVTFIAAAQDAKKDEGSLCIPIGIRKPKLPESVKPIRSLVEFPHSRHFIYNCKECHHKWNQDAQLLTCATSNCHDLVKTPNKATAGKPANVLAVQYYKKAFHQKCIGCHQQIKKQNVAKEKSPRLADKNLTLQNTGPTGCIQCHPKA